MSDPAAVPAEDVPDHAARAAELERRLADMEAMHRSRLVHAELKAEAVRHGMVDLDGLKLVDVAKVEMDDAGEVRGAAALMRDLKRNKPWLFGQPVASSSTATPPAAAVPTGRSAMKMSHADWQAARAELLRRH